MNLADQMAADAGVNIQSKSAPSLNLSQQMANDVLSSEQVNSNPSQGGSAPDTLRPFGIDTGIQLSQPVSNFLAGAGKAGEDLVRGAGQYLGLENRADVAQSRQLDAPLMQTTAGKLGDVAGSIAYTTPALLVPGANTGAGATLTGAIMGALQPSTSTGETASNIGTGAATALAGSWIGKHTSDFLAARSAAAQQQAAQQASLMAERDAVLAKASSAGYKVPPTAINPNITNTALESVSGKAATRQVATADNQQITNNLVRQDFGLPASTPLSPQALETVRSDAGKVYASIKKSGPVVADPQYAQDIQSALTGSPQLDKAFPGIGSQTDQRLQDLVKSVAVPQADASDFLEGNKFLRQQAKANYQAAFSSGNPDTLALARGQSAIADSMEDLIARNLQSKGQGELANQWNSARQTIAKSYSAEAALNGNDVSASKLAMQARKGKPMSGGMELASQFGTHFPDVAGLPKSGAGVSKLAAMVGLLGEGGALFAHSPELAAGTAVAAAAPYAVRGAILSGTGQRLLATPNYMPGTISTELSNLIQGAGKAGTLAGGIPLGRLMNGSNQ